MTFYQFESEWVLTAPAGKVFDALMRYEDYPIWWPAIRNVRLLDKGDENRLGARVSYSIRSPLLYSLDFVSRVTAVERPAFIEISASGDLAGVGKYVISDRNGVTSARYLWSVSTTKPWMNAVAPVARRPFAWAHHSVMRDGGQGLAQYLGGQLTKFRSHLVGDEISHDTIESQVS
jgi:uncharacterized membrane protein